LSQTGDIEYKPVILQLGEVVKENIALYAKTAQQKNIEIYTQIPEHVSVKADKNMLDFIFRNLITNALKFSNVNGKIDILAHHQKNKMVISIKDFGVGMTQEHLEKVFKPEEHISTLGTNAEKGTGFGLLLCKNFVEKNQGTIRIESQPGKGTLIEFTLEKIE
jgi:signal transduction histidine kinase